MIDYSFYFLDPVRSENVKGMYTYKYLCYKFNKMKMLLEQ